MIDNVENLTKLPKRWVWTTLKDVCLQPQYGWTTSAVQQGRLRLLRTTDITSGKINWECVPFCEKEPDDKSKYLLEDGDIVISRAGSVGFSLLIRNPKESIFASYLIRFKPLIDEDYAAYFLKTPVYWGVISEKKLGIALANVNATKLKEIAIPVAPLNEQKRIVAKIEELFTRLDAGVEALKKVKAELKRYRQVVLKYAFEGKLTAEWREKNKDRIEPASKLLERIAKEREKTTKGKTKKLPMLDTSELPELPDGWEWARLGQICKEVTKVNPKDNPEHKFVYLDIESIENRVNKITNPKQYSGKDAPSRARQLVKANDILFSTVRTYLRNIAMVDKKFDGQIASTGFCVIRPHEVIDRCLIFFLTLSDSFINPLSKIQRGTSYPAVRDSDVFEQVVPVIPIQEQRQIVSEIERHFSIADEIEQTIEKSLKEAERLRQSILKRAFEGKLVEQNPEDVPAEELLKRIKAEKAKLQTEQKAKKKLKKSREKIKGGRNRKV